MVCAIVHFLTFQNKAAPSFIQAGGLSSQKYSPYNLGVNLSSLNTVGKRRHPPLILPKQNPPSKASVLLVPPVITSTLVRTLFSTGFHI